MIGSVQRNEADTFTQFVRPDSTPCEPGVFLTFSELDDSPRIYSVRQTTNKTEVRDILYLWTNFDDDVWFYFLDGLIICSVVFAFIPIVMQRRARMKWKLKAQIKSMVGIFIGSMWNYFMLSVDMAATMIMPYKSAMILWTTIVIIFFYAFHMVLMGTLSTDLTVPVTLRTIESLKDLLYDPEFNDTQPIIFKQMNMYSVLKNSRNGTDAKVLFEKIRQNESSVVTVDAKNMQGSIATILGLIEKAVDGEVALIENSQIVDLALIHLACYFNPDLISKIKPANDIISQSMMSLLVSKETPKSVRKFLQYKLVTASELSLMRATISSKGKTMLTTVAQLQITTNGLICGEKFDRTFWHELDLPWDPFPLQPFVRLIQICLGFMVFGFTILVVEYVYSKLIVTKKGVSKEVVAPTREVNKHRIEEAPGRKINK